MDGKEDMSVVNKGKGRRFKVGEMGKEPVPRTDGHR